MPNIFCAADPVLVHHNVAFYYTYRNDTLDEPRTYRFTTDPLASDYDDPFSFDIRDFADIASGYCVHSEEDRFALLKAIAEHPKRLYQGDDPSMVFFVDELGEIATTEQQDTASLLAACIESYFDNEFPTAKRFHSEIDGKIQTIFAIPQAPESSFALTLYSYDGEVDWNTLRESEADRIGISERSSVGNVLDACCDAIGIDRIRTKSLGDKLHSAAVRASSKDHCEHPKVNEHQK